MRDQLEGTVVLVVGAGGSVGSELCRQIAGHRPARLLMLDHDDCRLAMSWLSLGAASPARWEDLLLADIRDLPALTELMVPVHPDVVFHAAGLKDRHLLQRHPGEAWLTNVVGTRNVLEAATQAGVGLFVNLSSAAASDEGCVLGKTEQLAEELTARWAFEEPGRYVSVRFDDEKRRSEPGVLPDLCRQVLAAAADDLDGSVVEVVVTQS